MIKHVAILIVLFFTTTLGLYAQNNKKAEITLVTIDTINGYPNAVQIKWKKSPLGTETNYTLQRKAQGVDENNLGQFNSGVFEYIDQLSPVTSYQVGYTVSTTFYDNTGETSNEHKTIFLNQPVYDTCNRSVSLRWEKYYGWLNTDVKYYVYYIDSTGNKDKADIQQGKNIIDIINLKYSCNYRFFVEAVNTVTTDTSRSNVVTLFTFKPENVNPGNLYFIDIDNSTFKPLFKFSSDTANHDVESFELEKSADNQNYTFVKTFDNIITTHSVYNQVTTLTYYRLVSGNKCNPGTQISAVACPVILSNTATVNNVVELNWNKCYIDNISEYYKIYLSIDNGAFNLLSLPDSVDINQANIDIEKYGSITSKKYTFFVEALSTDSFGNKQTAKSNTVTVEKETNIFIPNAFTPNGDGVNDYFEPRYTSFEPIEFYLIVFDRYGGVVYESDPKNQLEKRWNGKYNDKNVAEGAYLYHIKIVSVLGDVFEKRGVINVIYP